MFPVLEWNPFKAAGASMMTTLPPKVVSSQGGNRGIGLSFRRSSTDEIELLAEPGFPWTVAKEILLGRIGWSDVTVSWSDSLLILSFLSMFVVPSVL
jgi:hypothetical protein